VNNENTQKLNLAAAVKEYKAAIANRDFNHSTVLNICKKYGVLEKQLKAPYHK
jgi:hypothetical protein